MRICGDLSNYSTKMDQTELLTGASRSPLQNFRICRDTFICKGVTGGSLCHDNPAVNKKYKCTIKFVSNSRLEFYLVDEPLLLTADEKSNFTVHTRIQRYKRLKEKSDK